MGFFAAKKTTAQAASASPRPAATGHLGLPPPASPNQASHPYGDMALQPQPSYFQPTSEHLPAAPAWASAWGDRQPVPPFPAYCPPQDPSPPIIVNQHYYLSLPPVQQYPAPYSAAASGPGAFSQLKLGSAADVANALVPANVVQEIFDDGLSRWHGHATQLLNQSAALYDQIANRFDDIMTRVDEEALAGNERELFSYNSEGASSPSDEVQPRAFGKKQTKGTGKKGQTTATSSLVPGAYFAKVDLYANSRLPMNLPPMKLHLPTYPLLCLAAQSSERVYDTPRGAERSECVGADWRHGTKAMCIKSVARDNMNTIVFAIRGTASFMDWAVNLNTAPASPDGFLDDAGNLCHAGFLSAARKMVAPVAARLRQLLQELPERASYTLLITGHSAGGAVASLLYSHMLSSSQNVSSELSALASYFKRIHCITFGTPPISLLPLQRPNRPDTRKSLFLSFVNEGDPVARADMAYVRSLLELFAAPAPSEDGNRPPPHGSKLLSPAPASPTGQTTKLSEKKSRLNMLSMKASKMSLRPVPGTSSSQSPSPSSPPSSAVSPRSPRPVWQVPPSTLSSAGRIVVLRSGDPHAAVRGKKTVEERLDEGVAAQWATDGDLRGVVWGDPVCHMMKLYAGRVETLAVAAVTGKGRR